MLLSTAVLRCAARRQRRVITIWIIRRITYESKTSQRLWPPRPAGQVQKMQDEIRAKQDELEAREYTGTASGEMVTVTMTGKHEVTAIKIKPEAVDPDDLEMLEDLIAAAVNSAVAAVDKDSDEEMAKMTGGMNIPGLG